MNTQTAVTSESGVCDAIVIGAGMGGLGAAAQLQDDGLERVVVLEKASDLGGVWRDNTYPNVACDTPIDIYTYSFFPGRHWSTNFAPGSEIVHYLREFASAHDVEKLITFDTEVRGCVWNDKDGVWDITSVDGRSWRARFVVWSGGVLSQPLVPDLPGMDTFAGEMFHTAKWPKDLNLEGKTAAVVGGGASAIQVVPFVAETAEKAYSFIRTPSYVMPRPEEFYSEEQRADPEFANQQKARREAWMERFEFVTKSRFPMDLEVVLEQEAEWQKQFDKYITDPHLRKILTPDYRFGCKRPLFSNAYYQAMNNPNLTAIGDGISEVFEGGLIDNHGNRYSVDVIIWATGFDPAHMMGPLDVVGRDGRHLSDLWVDIPSAYYGTLVKGFPNFFLMGGPNAGGASQSAFFESQLWLISEAIRKAGEADRTVVEVSGEVHDRFNERVQEMASESVLIRGNCVSFYLSDKTGGVFTHWPATIEKFEDGVRKEAAETLTYGCASPVYT